MTIFFNKTIIHILKLLSPNNKTLVFIVYPIEIAFTINTIIDIGKVKNNKVNIPIEPKYLIYSFILVIVKWEQ